MPDALARTMAALVAILLVAATAVLYVTSRPAAGAQQVVAEFQDAFPLLEGMHVRVDGAVAGSVATIELSDKGLAEVTLVLDDAIEDATADATASIRQQDTTGDSYVDYDPGAADRPLRERDGLPTIACDAAGPRAPCASTLVAPRFDDLLNTFGANERAGIKLILVELSNALEQRGTDLNEAALDLRPALVAANAALDEVNQQNAALRPLIADAEAVTAQGAARRAELARLIDSLATTLGVTVAETEALDTGLERLPETVRRTRSTLAALTRAANAGRPLAREVGKGAPLLATSLRQAPGFLADADAVLARTRPTLELTRKLLRAGAPTIKSDPKRVVTGTFDLAPAISNLLTGVLGDEHTIKALFGDDSGGVGEGTLDNFGLAAIAVEPGNQLGYPPEHADRNFLRISAVFNCTMFGVPVEPGCLAGALRAARETDRPATTRRGQRGPHRSRGGSAEAGGQAEPPAAGPDPAAGAGPDPGPGLPDVPTPDLGEGLDDLGPNGGGLGGGHQGPGGGQQPGDVDGQALDDLLDFLLD